MKKDDNTFDKKREYIEQQKELFSAKIKTLAEGYESNPLKLIEYLQFAAKFYQYSPKNVVMIKEQNPNAAHVHSFEKWKQMGSSILKGEHGLNIWVPVKITFLKEGEEFIQLSKATKEQKKSYLDGKIPSYEKLTFKLGNVFDISQTNFPKEQYPELLSVGYESVKHDLLFQGLKDFAEAELHCPVQLKDLSSITLKGQYVPQRNQIRINQILEDSDKFSVLAHEVGHAIVHNKENMKNTKKSESQIEFEGDSISVMLHEKFRIPFPENQQSHLAHHYKCYVSEIKTKYKKEQQAHPIPAGKGEIEADNVFGEAFGRVHLLYEKHIGSIEKHIEKYLEKGKVREGIPNTLKRQKADLVKGIGKELER